MKWDQALPTPELWAAPCQPQPSALLGSVLTVILSKPKICHDENFRMKTGNTQQERSAARLTPSSQVDGSVFCTDEPILAVSWP